MKRGFHGSSPSRTLSSSSFTLTSYSTASRTNFGWRRFGPTTNALTKYVARGEFWRSMAYLTNTEVPSELISDAGDALAVGALLVSQLNAQTKKEAMRKSAQAINKYYNAQK